MTKARQHASVSPYDWREHNVNGGFMRRSSVPSPAIIPSMEILEGCKKGMTKRMLKAKPGPERRRLKEIREEIQSLIDML